MTRRKGQNNSRDALDLLIRAALHQSVRGAAPSPRVWERIKKRVQCITAVDFLHSRPQSIFERRPTLSPWLMVDIFHPLLSNGLRVL